MDMYTYHIHHIHHVHHTHHTYHIHLIHHIHHIHHIRHIHVNVCVCVSTCVAQTYISMYRQEDTRVRKQYLDDIQSVRRYMCTHDKGMIVYHTDTTHLHSLIVPCTLVLKTSFPDPPIPTCTTALRWALQLLHGVAGHRKSYCLICPWFVPNTIPT